MKIELNRMPIRDVVAGYADNGFDGGVVAYGGKLDIRPKYQREFVYDWKERNAVIATINKGFPLNVMYWMVREDGNFEVLDGQQRTISIAQYVNGDFSLDNKFFYNLTDVEKNLILDYELMIYFCEGTDKERLEWFKTINIAGKALSEQEINNAVYSGPWVTDAKRYFSRRGIGAADIGSDYLSGSAIRQEYLATAIKWINNGDVEGYMAKNQHEQNANELWLYFKSVIAWIEATFTTKRAKFMRGVDWGALYNQYKDKPQNTAKIEAETAKLIADDDVERKSGIYPYILTRNEKHLSIRAFTDSMKQKVYEKQNGKCKICKKPFDISEMEGDHIKPWREGGKTTEGNCQMLCKADNRAKAGK